MPLCTLRPMHRRQMRRRQTLSLKIMTICRRVMPHPKNAGAAGVAHAKTHRTLQRANKAAMYQAFVALGGNLGDAVHTLQQALQDLADLPGTQLLRTSSFYRTAPWQASGPDFINAVALLQTELSPHDLLAALQALENRAGRQRPYPNAPRTLDLDIVCMQSTSGPVCMDDAQLTLPHPRMYERAFVLVPLAEIAPQCVTQAQLDAVADQTIRKVV